MLSQEGNLPTFHRFGLNMLEEFDEKVQNKLAGGTTGHHACYSAQEREERTATPNYWGEPHSSSGPASTPQRSQKR